jgi:hypothetical protein
VSPNEAPVTEAFRWILTHINGPEAGPGAEVEDAIWTLADRCEVELAVEMEQGDVVVYIKALLLFLVVRHNIF